MDYNICFRPLKGWVEMRETLKIQLNFHVSFTCSCFFTSFSFKSEQHVFQSFSSPIGPKTSHNTQVHNPLSLDSHRLSLQMEKTKQKKAAAHDKFSEDRHHGEGGGWAKTMQQDENVSSSSSYVHVAAPYSEIVMTKCEIAVARMYYNSVYYCVIQTLLCFQISSKSGKSHQLAQNSLTKHWTTH